MDSIQSLNMTIKALTARVEALEGAPKAAKAAAKAKAPKDASEPKKAANWFIAGCKPIREELKALVEAYNASHPDAKKLPGTVAPQVGRSLKQLEQFTPTVSPSPEQIKEAFQDWLTAYEAGTLEPDGPRLREEASARRSAASSASGGKAAKPKAELSEEEAAAKRSQKAAKAAATRAANKAAKAAAEAEPEAAPEAEAELGEDEEAVDEYMWMGDIGKGKKAYNRIDHGGKAYIYTTDGDYLGAWDEKAKTMDKTVKDLKEA
jgi:hypothetical protein